LNTRICAPKFSARGAATGRAPCRKPAGKVVQDCLSQEEDMKFRPLHDRLVVRRIEAEEKTAGGVIIPDTAKEKPQEGEVLAVGPGSRDEKGALVPLEVKVGDRILFGKWSGTEVRINGEDLLIMKESDVLGILARESDDAKKAA
jgi:chaperonin GroES